MMTANHNGNDDASLLMYINDDLATRLQSWFNHNDSSGLSFKDILDLLVISLYQDIPLQETPYTYADLQMLVRALESKKEIAGPDKLDDFRYPWIKMADTFFFSRSLKNDDPNSNYPNNQPHCRFLLYKEGSANRTSRFGEVIRPARAVFLVGAAAHLIPRKRENLLWRAADHHIDYVIDKLQQGKWGDPSGHGLDGYSVAEEYINLIGYHLEYPEHFVDSVVHIETVFRAIHRGICTEHRLRDWSIMLGLPLYVVKREACVEL